MKRQYVTRRETTKVDILFNRDIDQIISELQRIRDNYKNPRLCEIRNHAMGFVYQDLESDTELEYRMKEEERKQKNREGKTEKRRRQYEKLKKEFESDNTK